MLLGHPEEVSLRPSANSMMFKQTNINPNLPLNSGKQQAPPLPRPPIPGPPLPTPMTERYYYVLLESVWWSTK